MKVPTLRRPTGTEALLALTAVVVVAVLALFTWIGAKASAREDAELRANQVAACQRGNVARAAINAQAAVLSEFLQAAADARRAAGTPLDVQTADRYLELADRLEEVPVPDCEAVLG